MLRQALAAVTLPVLLCCSKPVSSEVSAQGPSAPAETASTQVAESKTELKQPGPVSVEVNDKSTNYRLPDAARVVAIGDVHGDLEATLGVLRLVGAIGEKSEWVGGRLTVVQTGDQLDRGDGERQILDLFERLQNEATAAGGRFLVLNGNHEVMNVEGDFRYATSLGTLGFSDITSPALPAPLAARIAEPLRGRATAFFPGGRYARQFASRPIIAAVGDTVFVHGGVLSKHVAYGIDRLNREASEWMRGVRPRPQVLSSQDAPIWTRLYSLNPDAAACAELDRVLLQMQAKRMVVGHTVQQAGISHACNERVWRIDIGLAAHYGSRELAALEMSNGQVRVLRTAKVSQEPVAAE